MGSGKTTAVVVKRDARAASVERDPRWAVVRARGTPTSDAFFFSVETTGVYCHPSCAARSPRPENVAFHPSVAAAARAGFRPCKRCKPDQPPLAERRAAQVTALCRFIEGRDEMPSLAQLADHAGLSIFHVHRLFKSVTGVTPKTYGAAQRAARLRGELRTTGTVTEAIYGAGYTSAARFYERASMVLGMTPSRYRAGGKDLKIRFAIGRCSLGSILIATSKRHVCAVLLGGDSRELARDLRDRFPNAHLVRGNRQFGELVASVLGHVENPRLGTWLPLDIRETAFQERVREAFRELHQKATVPRASAQVCAGSALW